MKKFYFLLFLFLTSAITPLTSYVAFAQVPHGINYQAVARDVSGNPLITTTVSVTFNIHRALATGPISMAENQNTSTNAFGLFTLVIGSVNAAAFDTINWGSAPYFLEVVVNTYTMGTTQFVSVPYALFSGGSSTPGFSRMQVFNSSGIFTAPPGITKVLVEVWGGGGGGGGGGGIGNTMSSGGGGGGNGKSILSVTPSTNYTVTVGSGGSGGPAAQPGSTGGTSSFGNLISAAGGAGGTTASSINVGAGGNVFNGALFTVSGESGFTGCLGCSGFYLLPHGGMAGNGGSGGIGYSGAAGGVGIAPGGGGGGTIGSASLSGGTGASGRVVVWW